MHSKLSIQSMAGASRLKRGWWIKPLVFLVCLLPLASMVYGVVSNTLGANPVETLSRESGEWTLRLLLLGLLASPLQSRLKWLWPVRVRRMLGLFAFFYACLHLLVFIGLDQQFFWSEILREIVGKPYLLAGLASVLILIPLAVTSNNAMMRRLGKRWKSLHRWVYFAALAACLHFVWLAKGDKPEPVIYLAILLVLLGWRLLKLIRNSNSGKQTGKTTG